MHPLSTYKLTLKTLSPMIISPRASYAFYRGALRDDKDEAFFCTGKMSDDGIPKMYSTIYPAYRYGEYDCFNPKDAKYYIPGSSIKGALTAGTKMERAPLSMMVEDVTSVKAADYQVISAIKSQYFDNLPLPDEWNDIAVNVKANKKPSTNSIKMPQLLPFFAGTVGIEVLGRDESVTFDVTVRYKGDMSALLKETRQVAMGKRDRYLRQLEAYQVRIDCLHDHYPANDLQNREQCKIASNGLRCVIDFVNKLHTCGDGVVFSLGGYKGLIRSLSQEGNSDQSGIFVDDKYRPFGYVKIDKWERSA